MENKNEINIKEAYRAKLTKGWRELVDGWSLDEKIVEKIKKTAAAAACYQSLMSEEDEDYMLYLLRFKDPLGIVADGYLATLEMAVEEDLYQIVNDLMDAPGTDFKYPLDPEWAEKDVLLYAFLPLPCPVGRLHPYRHHNLPSRFLAASASWESIFSSTLMPSPAADAASGGSFRFCCLSLSGDGLRTSSVLEGRCPI